MLCDKVRGLIQFRYLGLTTSLNIFPSAPSASNSHKYIPPVLNFIYKLSRTTAKTGALVQPDVQAFAGQTCTNKKPLALARGEIMNIGKGSGNC